MTRATSRPRSWRRAGPASRIGTAGRLWAATALCLVPFGMTWTVGPDLYLPGGTVYGSPCNDAGYCAPDIALPGVLLPGSTVHVSQAPIRVFLLIGAGLLALVAVQVRTVATRRVARLATASIAVGAALAAGNGSSQVLLCLLVALALAGPPAWRTRAAPPVFGTTTFRR